MYNTKVICTYNTPEIFFASDKINDEEKDFIRDTIYRQEMLDILGMDDYNEKEIDKAIQELYQKVKDNTELKECMLKLAGNFMSIDEEFGLMVMFAYDYMYLTHICVSELFETGKITENNICKLKSIIF